MRITKLLPLMLLPLLLSSCGLGAELNSCKDTANRFMELMAKADARGAYELCEPSALNYDSLQEIINNPDNRPVWNDYQGLEFGDGGQKTEKDNAVEIRLAPATPKGHDQFEVHFAFRKTEKGWRVIGFLLSLKSDSGN